MVENDLIRKLSFPEYRRHVQRVYDGPKGAVLSVFSTLSLHVPLGERLFRRRQFDLRGARNILDVGSGAGQIVGHLVKYADRRAQITCCDLSPEMMRRTRSRFPVGAARYLVSDVTQLPFPSGAFDCITCGYVLEHLPEARAGLAELARVLVPGGRMLLLTSEDNFLGAWTSRLWCCRTYDRQELRQTCTQAGLEWAKELWFSRLHERLRAGGICVELRKAGSE
jgi:ubiquinone/menaquinone biosynthesis C-methylase UbiE